MCLLLVYGMVSEVWWVGFLEQLLSKNVMLGVVKFEALMEWVRLVVLSDSFIPGIQVWWRTVMRT